jgi:CTP:molybdopterin cytidylyltransferase MocA
MSIQHPEESQPYRSNARALGGVGATMRPLEEPQRSRRSRPDLVDVVLPAGGRIQGDFAHTTGVSVKALISLEGESILRRTIGILRATGQIGRIVVIGPEEALEEARAAGAEGAIAEGATGPENIFRGLEWLRSGANGVLIATTDLPFLTPEAIHWFLSACPPEAEVALPLVSRQAFEARFPGMPSTYTPLRDGQFTLGCLFMIQPQTLLRNRQHLEQVFQARKSNWQMARLIGVRVALRFLLRQLTIDDIVVRAGSIMNCRGAAVLDAPAELAYDIDLPEEYAYALSHLAGQAASPPSTPSRTPRGAQRKETMP